MKKELKTLVVTIAIALCATPALANEKMMTEKFNPMDTNSDGMISADEHAAWASSEFTKADKDGNGSLSMQEFKDKMMMMKHKMKKDENKAGKDNASGKKM